jgi:hypothetical protein
VSKNFNDNEPPKRGFITPFLRKNCRAIYITAFITGAITAIAAMSGWMAAALPFWLILFSIFFSRLDEEQGNHAELGVFWGGIAIELIMFKILLGWPWFVWLLVAFPAYVGFASLTTALYEFVSRMYRS